MIKLLFLIGLVVFVYQESHTPLWHHLTDQHWLANYIHLHGLQGICMLLLCGFLLTGCGGPRQLVAFVFAYLFGPWLGLMMTLVCTLGSAICVYGLSRSMLKPWVSQRFAVSYTRFQDFVQAQPFLNVLIIRLFPVGSNLFTNLLSGVAQVPFWAFTAASLIGYFPQTLIFSFAGSGLGEAETWQVVFSLILGAVSLILSRVVYRRYRHPMVQKTCP